MRERSGVRIRAGAGRPIEIRENKWHNGRELVAAIALAGIQVGAGVDARIPTHAAPWVRSPHFVPVVIGLLITIGVFIVLIAATGLGPH